jgi:hypothetical protein
VKRVLREPLLHFLVLGAVLFIAYGYVDGDAPHADPQTIVVDRKSLITLLQYRLRVLDTAQASQRLNSLSHEQLEHLIRDFVREEALYREAKALRLDEGDRVERLRLIQRLEFITRGFADTQTALGREEVERYYSAHRPLYAVPPTVTFTHVFFSNERHGPARAEALARAELRKLNRDHVTFEQAPAHGEPFLYEVNYVQREPEDVASHFGSRMQQALFALKSSEDVWQGPFRSPYGSHLVLLTTVRPAHVPPLDEIRARIEQDAREAALEARFERSVQAIVSAYKVKVEPVQRSPQFTKAVW